LAKELTKKFQRYYRGSVTQILEDLADVQIKGEWVVIIAAKEQQEGQLGQSDVLSLDIAPKIKAKLLSKITGKSVKECYENVISTQNTAKI